MLGGSSKLAALAAKRRKEREEAQAATNTTANGEADEAIAMLDKLSVKGKESDASTLGGGGQEAGRPPRASRYPVRRRSRSHSPEPEVLEKEDPDHLEAPQPAVKIEFAAARAAPSMFASTLCGPNKTAMPPALEVFQVFEAPYANYKEYQDLNPFDGPSPDDIVRAAQAKKGAGAGRR